VVLILVRGIDEISFFLHHRVQTGSGVNPASCVMGSGDLTPGIKRLGRAADHSPTSSVEIKNAWSYASTPPVCLHGAVHS
jgi:hypothetical protein